MNMRCVDCGCGTSQKKIILDFHRTQTQVLRLF